MTWNYRVMECETHELYDNEKHFEFKEVYYHEDGTLDGWCDAHIFDDSVDGLQKIVERLQEALEKPILTDNDFRRD